MYSVTQLIKSWETNPETKHLINTTVKIPLKTVHYPGNRFIIKNNLTMSASAGTIVVYLTRLAITKNIEKSLKIPIKGAERAQQYLSFLNANYNLSNIKLYMPLSIQVKYLKIIISDFNEGYKTIKGYLQRTFLITIDLRMK